MKRNMAASAIFSVNIKHEADALTKKICIKPLEKVLARKS